MVRLARPSKLLPPLYVVLYINPFFSFFFFLSLGISGTKSIAPSDSQSTSTGSMSSLSLSKRWIDNCLQTHAKSCRSVYVDGSTKELRLPGRLIDVGSVSGGNARLVDTWAIPKTGGSSADVRYLTLSHRWGVGKPLSLVAANQDELGQEINPHHLSRTFRDAIHVTRQIGLRYLWIDSLCILQDSKEDWERESAIMGEIYSNSQCNIVAMAPEDGLFFDRSPYLIRSTPVSVQWMGEPAKDFVLIMKSCIRLDNAAQVPIFRRGWILQEQLLSPRALLFTKEQVFWECCHLEASEAHPHGMPPSDRRRLGYYPEQDGFGLSRLGLKRFISTGRSADMGNRSNLSRKLGEIRSRSYQKGMGDRDERWYIWREIVEDFTGRDLTVKSDRLVALSGIASALSTRFGSAAQYIYGLWIWRSSDLVLAELMWHVYSGRARRPLGRAPTWSWGSVDGKIRYFREEGIIDLDKLASFTRVHGVDKEEGPRFTGETGAIVLNAPVVPFDWAVSTFYQDTSDALGDSAALRLLGLLSSYLGAPRVFGLVVKEVPGGAYKRVGIFEWEDEPCRSEIWNKFQYCSRVTVQVE